MAAHIRWPDYTDTKRILAGIVQENNGPFAKKTNLFKAYYWAHRFYWEDHVGTLTREHHIVRMPNGPGIDRHKQLIEELHREQWLDVLWRPFADGDDDENGEYEFRAIKAVDLTPEERDSIHRAIARVRDKPAWRVSKESHADSRSWNESKDGEPLDVYLDTVPDADLQEREKSLDRAHAELAGIFKKASDR